MKIKTKLIWLILLSSYISFSQQVPVIKVEKDSLGLRSLEIKVEVVGNMATTTYDMTFYNSYDRVLEGELSFPLGQNQTVSRFALDLNGKLREAVVVEKEIGRVAFETTIRQKIDPALLEQTKGNNYKARIYPIPAKGTKRVVLSYEQELILNKSAHYYQLPLNFKNKLRNFNLEMVVFQQTIKPSIQEDGIDNFNFEAWQQSYIAKYSKENYTPDKSLTIKIPVDIEKEKIITDRNHFYIYKTLDPNKKVKRKPNNIELYWDSSYSMKNKNIKEELSLLENYFKYIQNSKVTVIKFSNTIKSRTKFVVKNGNWQGVKLHLEKTNYDGGTSYKNILDGKSKVDEYIFFTDGIENLGKFNDIFKKPVYIVNSLVSSDHNYLDQICTSSGGNYLNLNNLSVEQAVDLLKYNTYRFLGTSQKSKKKIEIYPNYVTTLNNDFSVSGKDFNNNDKVLLHFGYGNKIYDTYEFTLKQGGGENDKIRRIWAQKKLRSLNREKENNKSQIIDLSKNYQLISPYTSLIVLDRIEDYVRYEITPPKEMLEEYNQLISERRDEKDDIKEELKELRDELIDEYEDLNDWLITDFKFTKEEEKKPVITAQSQNDQTSNNNSQTPTPDSENDDSSDQNNNNSLNNISESDSNDTLDPNKPIIKGTITDESGSLPGASVLIEGTTNGTITDFDGKYSINANEGDVIRFSFIGYATVVKTVASEEVIDIEMIYEANSLDEVVTVAYSSQLQGRVAGVQITESNEVHGNSANVNIRGASSMSSNNAPLYVVDGIVIDEKPEFNSEDIESTYVLKAAQATELYGSKASSGVVIITTKKGVEENYEQIQELEDKINDNIELKAWDVNSPYLKDLNETKSIQEAYNIYLKLRDTYKNVPAFYLDVADYFGEANDKNTAIQILTNIAEIDINNYELLRAIAYKLEYFKEYEMATYLYREILELRPEDIQSYRDLALSYQEIGEYQKALDLFYKIINGELLEKDMDRRFEGIEAVAFVEMNNLIRKYKDQLNLNAIDKNLIKNTNVDLRVVIDWNHNDTDIDLWVIDPNTEKCYYKHTKTKIGGRMSYDMTEGFGPEEFLLKKAIKGDYKFFIDYFSDEVQKISGPTFLKVTVFTNYGTKKESKRTNVYRLDKEDDEIEIGSLKM